MTGLVGALGVGMWLGVALLVDARLHAPVVPERPQCLMWHSIPVPKEKPPTGWGLTSQPEEEER